MRFCAREFSVIDCDFRGLRDNERAETVAANEYTDINVATMTTTAI